MHPIVMGAQRPLAAFTVAAVAATAFAAVTPRVAQATDPAGIVLEWNRNAVDALTRPTTATPPGAGQAPTVAAIHLAMVQTAVYDAVNAIVGGHEPYLAGLPAAPATASQAAAAATAAHRVLVGLAPALPAAVRDHLDAQYAATLGLVPDGQAEDDGVAIGAAAAAAMLAERQNDGRHVPFAFSTGTAIGRWRPVLPSFASDPAAWVGNVRPFTLDSAARFRTEGPPALSSAAYAADFDEVKRLGGQVGSERTDAQTDLARFVSASPPGMVYAALRSVAVARNLDSAEQARLLAMATLSNADAMITCWNDKEHWSFWRPITAIRDAASDGNPATTPQADWLPFSPTPGYPEHPSGFNCFAASVMYAARAYFGTDKVTFQVTSPATGTTRTYHRFTDFVDDAIDGRIYLGYHFRTADVQGAWIGKKVAQWVDRKFLGSTD